MMKKIENEKGYVKYHLEDEEEMIFIIDDIQAIGRRNGNGSALLKEVENEIKNQGGKRIELYAYPQDDDMTEDDLCDFYHKNGYSDNECKCDFSKDL